MTGHPPRRSVLCVPGGDERKISKAMASGADQVVIDLEDAVAPGGKERARALLDSVEWRDFAQLPSIAVRVNAPRSRWCYLDVEAVVRSSAPVGSIVLPKVESPGDIDFIERLLDGVESGGATARPIAVEALIETADGLGRVDEIAASSRRLSALLVGYADMAASLGRAADMPPELWIAVQDKVITAARTNRLDAVDGPFLGVSDDEEFQSAVRHGVRMGFDAKWAIHPRQIESINRAFEPTHAQIHHARRVVEALAAAHGAGRGAVELDGQMIDEAVAVAARRVLSKIGAAL
ncbi:HpcH/HpaI aldolase/citrate lyase family protein [Nocardia neocaledoniensis]|uniref:HpcH/HpaI aldolase/citrate lyase family protein n=1 Tax=Nocardia neocaledoniensis TaxID=236511 RepID=UPI0024583AD8|nr:CoA ester lyase [Nocardia neocaledoniensis]